MATQDSTLSLQYLKDILHYDSESGVFTRKVTTGNRSKAGVAVGSDDMYGYKTVRILKKSYKLHRLAWFYVHGQWPKGDIDHINGARSDNRIANLRDVSRKVNLQNQRKAQPSNKSTGILGVYPVGQRFMAKISIDNRCVSIGTYDTAEEAQKAYIDTKRRLHEGCTI